MSSLTWYNDVQVVTPDPAGAGGLAINNNFKTLSDDLAGMLPLAGGTMAGTLDLGGNDLTNGGAASFAGSVTLAKNTWHTSNDGQNRIYFVNNDETVFASPNGFVFQDESGNHICEVEATGVVAAALVVRGSNCGVIVESRTGSGTSFQWYNPTGGDLRLYAGGDILTIDTTGNLTLNAALNLTGGQITNLRGENASSAPSSPNPGQIYFNTTDSHFYGWNGSAWKQLDN